MIWGWRSKSCAQRWRAASGGWSLSGHAVNPSLGANRRHPCRRLSRKAPAPERPIVQRGLWGEKKRPHPALTGHLLPEGRRAADAVGDLLQLAKCMPSFSLWEKVPRQRRMRATPPHKRDLLSGVRGRALAPGALGDRDVAQRAPHGCSTWRPPGQGPGPERRTEKQKVHSRQNAPTTAPPCSTCARCARANLPSTWASPNPISRCSRPALNPLRATARVAWRPRAPVPAGAAPGGAPPPEVPAPR